MYRKSVPRLSGGRLVGMGAALAFLLTAALPQVSSAASGRHPAAGSDTTPWTAPPGPPAHPDPVVEPLRQPADVFGKAPVASRPGRPEAVPTGASGPSPDLGDGSARRPAAGVGAGGRPGDGGTGGQRVDGAARSGEHGPGADGAGKGGKTGGRTDRGRSASGVREFAGWGIDTCHTPSLATLRAWRSSRYRAIGVYYGGRARACPDQPELTAAWVREASRMGWKLLPVYVGSQSPCTNGKHKQDYAIGKQPWQQGRTEARDAVRRARTLGMRPSSPLYLDMEAYDRTDRPCAARTLSYVRGWDRQVRASGYLPGFYSSAESGVRHLDAARRAGTKDLPSVMWFARWGVPPSATKDPALGAQAWRPHRRVHQYAGNVTERHGGRRLTIDRNRVDAPVAVVGG